jgi:hypothetical protein
MFYEFLESRKMKVGFLLLFGPFLLREKVSWD